MTIKQTFIKTIIWRLIAMSITFLVGWAISGRLDFGIFIASIDSVLKTIGYFGYERLWLKFNDDKTRCKCR